MYVCVYVFMRLYTCACMYLCEYLHESQQQRPQQVSGAIRRFLCVCVCFFVDESCMYVCMIIFFFFTWACMYVCMCVYLHELQQQRPQQVSGAVRRCLYVYAYVTYMCMYVCVYSGLRRFLER